MAEAQPSPVQEYVPLSMDLFLSLHALPVDVYLRIGEAKYVRVAESGSDLTADRLSSYKDHDVSTLFLRKEDFARYVGFGLKLASKVQQINTIKNEKRVALLGTIGRLLAKSITVQGVEKETYGNARDFVQSAVTLITDLPDAVTLLSRMEAESDYLISHSLAVSVYSVLIARESSYTSPPILFRIAMGGLLHDTGLKELGGGILEKGRLDRTGNEAQLYETHPSRGAEILTKVDGIPSEVIQIALQHHENCLGTGYPGGLKRSRTLPLARLVAVADQFCDFALKNPDSPGMDAKSAIDKLMLFHEKALDPTFLAALMRVFKYPIPDRLQNAFDRDYS